MKNHFLKYPVYLSKTTSLQKKMNEEADFCRKGISSCMTVVLWVKMLKLSPPLKCKFLLVLKNGESVFSRASWIGVLNDAKPLTSMVYHHIRYFWRQTEL